MQPVVTPLTVFILYFNGFEFEVSFNCYDFNFAVPRVAYEVSSFLLLVTVKCPFSQQEFGPISWKSDPQYRKVGKTWFVVCKSG